MTDRLSLRAGMSQKLVNESATVRNCIANKFEGSPKMMNGNVPTLQISNEIKWCRRLR